jgi:TolB-like protein
MPTKLTGPALHLRFFGPFRASAADGQEIKISNKRAQAMLATAPDGRRRRAYLAECLWRSDDEHQRLSLRTALADLRRVLGKELSRCIIADKQIVGLRPGSWRTIGTPSDGTFLEGLEPVTPNFSAWLSEQRAHQFAFANEGQADALNNAQSLRATIGILPFSGTPGSGFDFNLGDMVAEELSRTFSSSSLLNVISHLSMRSFNLSQIVLDEVKSKLNIDFLVLGRVHSDGGDFRLNADLIEMNSGTIRRSFNARDKLQNFIAGDGPAISDISHQISHEILKAALEGTRLRPLHEVQDHDLMASAVRYMHQQSLGYFSRALPCLEELIKRKPRIALLHSWLAKWYILAVGQGWSDDIARDTARATDASRAALDLDPDCAFSLTIDGFVQNNLTRHFEIAASRFDEALSNDPNNALAWLLKGNMNAFMGNGQDAVACAARARSLSPLDPHQYFFDTLSATAHLANNEYETALTFADRSMRANSRHASTHRVRTIALQLLDRHQEAEKAAATLMQLPGQITVEGYLQNHSAATFAVGQKWASALEAAGVPRR